MCEEGVEINQPKLEQETKGIQKYGFEIKKKNKLNLSRFLN